MTARSRAEVARDRVTEAGLFLRSQGRGRVTDTVVLESAATAVADLTDRELADVAGYRPDGHPAGGPFHYGYRVRRWPGNPDTVTVELHTD